MIPENYAELVEQTSMLYWWPRLLDLQRRLGLNLPATSLLDVDSDALGPLLDGEDNPKADEELRRLKVQLVHTAPQVGGFPLFMRTEHLAGKHEWERTCYVAGADTCGRNIVGLVEASVMAEQAMNKLVLRALLPLRSRFTAFKGMPIAREFRFFVRDGAIDHWQPYWPASAFTNSYARPSREDWPQKLQMLSTLSEDEFKQLRILVQHVGWEIPGYWSIDLCQHINSKWYITDMARGELSYDSRRPEHQPKPEQDDAKYDEGTT